jgi:hypothetical protein
MYFPVLFAMLFSALWVVTLIHELGHLLAGKLVGLKCLGLHVPLVLISKGSGKLAFSFPKVRSLEGTALVQFDSLRRLSHRFRVFIAGGPLATALGMLAGYFVLKSEVLSGFAFGWTGCFVGVSFFVLVANLIPFKTKSGMFTDGARLKMLLFPSTRTYRWLANIALGLQLKSGKRPRLLNKRWLLLATNLNDSSCDELGGALYAYLAANDAEDETLAAAHLERCLQLSAQIGGPSLRNFFFLEASVFEAWFRKNTENCLKWRGRVSKWKTIPWFLVLRADTALLCSQGEIAKALRNCEEAIAKADTLPSEVNRERFREGWKEWMEQIHQRSATASLRPGVLALQE